MTDEKRESAMEGIEQTDKKYGVGSEELREKFTVGVLK
jgi:hypothetical protein